MVQLQFKFPVSFFSSNIKGNNMDESFQQYKVPIYKQIFLRFVKQYFVLICVHLWQMIMLLCICSLCGRRALLVCGKLVFKLIRFQPIYVKGVVLDDMKKNSTSIINDLADLEQHRTNWIVALRNITKGTLSH